MKRILLFVVLIGSVSVLGGCFFCGTCPPPASPPVSPAPTPPATTNWKFAPSLEVGRWGLAVVQQGGRLYAIGGWNGGKVLEIFDGSSWKRGAAMPKAQEGVAAAVVGNRIYCFGSYGWRDTTQIYDISTDTWSAGPPVPQGLYWSTAESIGTKVYLIAGYGDPAHGDSELKTLYILDTTTMTWSRGADLPYGIQNPTSAMLNGEIYVFCQSNISPGPRCFKYDPVADSWTTIPCPPSGHGSAAAAVSYHGYIFLIGGSPGSIFQSYTDTEIYHPATHTWFKGPDMNVGRQQFGAAMIGNKIYAVGGRDKHADPISSVEVLTILSP